MNKNFINIHLNNLNLIRKYKIELESISENNLAIIDEISNYVVNNQQYIELKSFNKLADILVEFIEKYNINLISMEDIKEYTYSFKYILTDLEEEIASMYKISVYFFGKDKYGFTKNSLTNINITEINSMKELKNICLSNSKANNDYNILLLENESIALKNIYFDEILPYSNIAKSLENTIKIIYNNNYEFNFLRYGLERCDKEDVDTIIVGNSYTLALDETKLNCNSVKLSCHSQDLYYSIQLAKKAIESNDCIKECIFNASYYILRHDLSSGLNDYSKNLVKKSILSAIR